MALTIYNTLTRQKEPFTPGEGGRVGMYACGPTVYDYPHVGHAKSYIAFDIVVRYLRHLGYDVLYVQNITDVGHLTDDADAGEDKILERARQRRVEPMALVETYTREYFAAMDQLNVLRPDISPRASGHIPEMIQLIEQLIAGGHAYVAEGNVYFDVASFPQYGKLSRRRLEEQEASGRVEAAPGKRGPADFALWKAAGPEHLMRWPSPWGWGYPGWHIECSAMSMKYLGETVDVHGAGVDNLFPHNEDEIAQSEAATHRPFVRYWLHNGSVRVDGEKMSKSKGNFTTIGDAIEKHGAMLLRFYLLNSHYRSPTDLSDEGVTQAKKAWENLQNSDREAERYLRLPRQEGAGGGDVPRLTEATETARAEFLAGMDDDFNTPAALAAVFGLSREINRFVNESGPASTAEGAAAVKSARRELRELLAILGLELPREEERRDDLSPGLMALILDMRQAARDRKDFAAADQIRARLADLGIVVEDRPEGPTWRVLERP
jgi:cysteinyl-tRNA synthetase